MKKNKVRALNVTLERRPSGTDCSSRNSGFAIFLHSTLPFVRSSSATLKFMKVTIHHDQNRNKRVNRRKKQTRACVRQNAARRRLVPPKSTLCQTNKLNLLCFRNLNHVYGLVQNISHSFNVKNGKPLGWTKRLFFN